MSTGGYASTSRGQIHYWECGDGPPLVLFAPAPRSARIYRRLLPLLSGFRVLALDTRGFGNSAPPQGPAEMMVYADDVVQVLDALAIERTHLCGLHTGNKIAAALAAGWPDRTDRVVLVGRTHSIIVNQAAREAAIRASMTARPKSNPGAPAREGIQERWALALREVSQIWMTPDVIGSEHLDDDALQLLRDEVIDEVSGWNGVETVYAANFAFDLAGALARVEAPTLVIELVTPETATLGPQAPLLQALMSNCDVLAIHEHERTLLRDHPERLATAVIDFLSRP